MKTIKIWIAETINDGIIWGDNYDDLTNTTLFFYPGSVQKIEISEKTYNKLNEVDGDGVPYHYLKRVGSRYCAFSF